MEPSIVFAGYRPHPGKENELEALLRRHADTLRSLELATDRPSVIVRSKNGTYIEVFEWANDRAVQIAHEHPLVAEIWEAMSQVCDYVPIGELEEAKTTFAHFEPMTL